MVSETAHDSSVGSEYESPVPEPIVPTVGNTSREAQGTDEEEKTAAQDTTSVESDGPEGEKGPALLYRVGKFLTWMPRRCRYDPDNPPKFNLALNLLFALVSPILAWCQKAID